jgi:hypothetical protein
MHSCRTQGTYTVVATNPNGTVTSTAVSIAVNNPTSVNRAPSIARQPVTQTVATGSTVVFAAEITSEARVAPLSARIGASLVISAARAADAGTYSVVATNNQGTVTSDAANLELSNDPNFGTW